MTQRKNKVPTSMTELRDGLALIFADIRDDVIDNMGKAKEMNNAAGKIIKSCAVQVEYAALRKEVPEIPFLK